MSHVFKCLKQREMIRRLTSLSQVFAGLGLCERGHLIELGMDAGVFEATEVDAFAVNHTI